MNITINLKYHCISLQSDEIERETNVDGALAKGVYIEFDLTFGKSL